MSVSSTLEIKDRMSFTLYPLSYDHPQWYNRCIRGNNIYLLKKSKLGQLFKWISENQPTTLASKQLKFKPSNQENVLIYERAGVKNHPSKLILKYVTYNSHGQNDECRINSQQKMSKRDFKILFWGIPFIQRRIFYIRDWQKFPLWHQLVWFYNIKDFQE